MQAKYDARNPAALKALVGAKTKVLPFPKDVLDLAYKEAMALYAEVSAKNENWKKVYADYCGSCMGQSCARVRKAGDYDSFMQAQKL